MPYDDTPKRWVDEAELLDENVSNSQMLMPAEEDIHLPTVEEQKQIIAEAEGKVSDENMQLLKGLVEINAMAEVLHKVRTQETQEHRRVMLDTLCETFMNSHYQNNILAEQLKRDLLTRLATHVNDMDLELSANTAIELMNAMGTDVAQAGARINGEPSIIPGQQGGINLTINTAEGAQQVTNQTLNNGTLIQSANKETVTLSNTIKQMQNLQMPKKKPIEVTYKDA